MTATTARPYRRWHAQVMSVYYAAREAQDLRAEAATMGYATELARYYGTDGEGTGVEVKLTFARFLRSMRGQLADTGWSA